MATPLRYCRRLPLWAAALALALPSPSFGQAQTAQKLGQAQRFGDITVSYDSLQWGQNGWHGYEAFKFTVSNTSTSTAHRVRLNLPKNQYNGELRSVSGDVQLLPQSSKRVVLWQPAMSMVGDNTVEVTIDGKLDRDHGLAGPNLFFTGSINQDTLTILPSARFDQQLRGWATNQALSDQATMPGRPHTLQNLGTSQWMPPWGPDTWNDNWLGYTKYDGVLITAAEFQALPEAVRNALVRYVECGGSLLIAGAWQPPPSWKQRPTPVAGLSNYRVGFGECLAIAEPNIQRWQAPQLRHIRESWQMSLQPFRSSFTTVNAHEHFPVVEDVAVPVRGLFLIMLCFVVVIGPINVYLLSRKKRRIWLLATVPLISLLTCLAVWCYMLTTVTWGAHERVESVTLLDENDGHAATLAWMGLYSTSSPGDGLHFSTATQLMPLGLSGNRPNNRGGRSIDWTLDQHLSPNWVTPRVPVYFLLRKSERAQGANNGSQGHGRKIGGGERFANRVEHNPSR